MRISDWSSDVCSSELRDPGRQADPAIARLGIVRPGEDRAPVRRQQFDRRDAIAGQVRVGADPLQMQPARRRVETQIGIAIVERGGRMVAPAILMAVLERAEGAEIRSEEHTSELQSLMRSSYHVFCLKKRQ